VSFYFFTPLIYRQKSPPPLKDSPNQECENCNSPVRLLVPPRQVNVPAFPIRREPGGSAFFNVRLRATSAKYGF